MIPAFIAHGVHTKNEIPEIIKTKQEELKLKSEDVETNIPENPLGADERIVQIIEEKALTIMGQETNENENCPRSPQSKGFNKNV